MRHFLPTFLIMVLALGCENATVKEMKAPELAPWDALSTFQNEPLRSVAYPKEMGNWAAAKAALKSATFEAGLTAFEQSPLPEGYADKAEKKTAMVQAWRAAIEAANSGSQEDLKAKVDAAMNAMSAL